MNISAPLDLPMAYIHCCKLDLHKLASRFISTNPRRDKINYFINYLLDFFVALFIYPYIHNCPPQL